MGRGSMEREGERGEGVGASMPIVSDQKPNASILFGIGTVCDLS
jgi:hypothetical protein